MKLVIYAGYQKTHFNSESIKTIGVGGSEQCIINLAKHLAKNNEVYVVGHVIEGTFDNVEYLTIENAIAKLKNQEIDCVIASNYINYLLELNELNFKKSLFWMHNTDYHAYHRGKVLENNGKELLQDKRLRNIVCLTEWHRQKISALYPEIEHKIIVIGNGINYESFNKSKTKYKDSFIYSSHAERGLKSVLNNWHEIRKSKPNAELHICTPEYGVDYYERYFSKRVDNMSGVKYHGTLSIENLYDLMSKCEYWYYPTNYEETFCITALEMLGHRVKPCTSNLAGLKETLNGFNCETTDDKINFKKAHEYLKTCDWSQKSLYWEEYIYNMSNEKNKIDCVYVISMIVNASKADNWKKAIRDDLLVDNGETPIALKQARNGCELTDEWMNERKYAVNQNWKIEDSDNDWWNRDITPGEIGCSISHYEVWKNAQKSEYENILVLEEDFRINTPLTQEIFDTIPEDFEMIYLGRNPVNNSEKEDPLESTRYFVKPNASYNSHAYILNKKAIDKLLSNDFEKNIIPLDDYLICNYADHPREDLRNIPQNVVTYATPKDKPIVSQRGKSSSAEGPRISKNLSAIQELYSFYEDPNTWVKKYISYPTRTKEYELIMDEVFMNCYSMPLFTKEFCEIFIEESERANVWTQNRHEYFPTNDFLLSDINFNEIYDAILNEYVIPAMVHAYALDGKNWEEMQAENFCARYLPEEQGHLSLHHDSAHLTALVTLSDKKDYVGGGTYFSHQKELVIEEQGYVSIHPGAITHKHGARAITEGSRYIIVSFLKNTKF
jgi:GR25 family glycosyltransferase involved in LPS biosynthesis/glycosyltransferase involved in cell wall biosynthesis